MSVRLLSIAIVMLAGAATAFGAKPPDLPQQIADDCCEQQAIGRADDGECCETPCPAAEKATAKHCPLGCSKSFSSCVLGCMMESLLPGLGLCEMCPVMHGKMEAMVHPCMKAVVGNCKQMMTQGSKDGCAACKQGACKDCQNACHGGESHECCEDDCCESGCYPASAHDDDPCGECCKGECKCKDGCKCQEKKKQVGQLIQALIGTGCPVHVKVTVHVEQCPICAMGSCAGEGCCGWVGGWVFKAIMRKPEKLTVMPREETSDTNGQAHRMTCPYLQEQAAKQHLPKKHDEQMAGTVLENMEKLIEARRLYMKAERCRHVGEMDKAQACYEKVEKLCPGSRFETLAKARLHAMHAAQGEEAELFQRKTPAPCEKCKEQADEPQAMKDLKVRFIDLLDLARCCAMGGNLADAQKYALEAGNMKVEIAEDSDSPLGQAQKMMESGCYSEARAVLIELYSGDCTCCKVAEMLGEIERIETAADSAAQVAEYLEAAQRAYTDGCLDEASRLVEQALRLDPACGSALYLRVMISQKRVEKGDAEPAEPPSSYDGIGTPFGMGLKPTLPAVDPKIVDALEKVLQESGAKTDVSVVRNPIDLLKQGACAEVDQKGQCDSGPRARFHIQVAGVDCLLVFDARGHGSFTVQLFPKASDKGSEDDDSEACDEPLYLLETELGSVGNSI